MPLAINYAKSEEAKRLIDVGIHDLNAITLAYSAPPGTPKDRFRRCAELCKRPCATAFLADAKAAQQEVDPMTGEDLAATVAGFKNIPAPVMAVGGTSAAEEVTRRQVFKSFEPFTTFRHS